MLPDPGPFDTVRQASCSFDLGARFISFFRLSPLSSMHHACRPSPTTRARLAPHIAGTVRSDPPSLAPPATSGRSAQRSELGRLGRLGASLPLAPYFSRCRRTCSALSPQLSRTPKRRRTSSAVRLCAPSMLSPGAAGALLGAPFPALLSSDRTPRGGSLCARLTERFTAEPEVRGRRRLQKRPAGAKLLDGAAPPALRSSLRRSSGASPLPPLPPDPPTLAVREKAALLRGGSRCLLCRWRPLSFGNRLRSPALQIGKTQSRRAWPPRRIIPGFLTAAMPCLCKVTFSSAAAAAELPDNAPLPPLPSLCSVFSPSTARLAEDLLRSRLDRQPRLPSTERVTYLLIIPNRKG